MIKAIVIAANFSQYATYMRNRHYHRKDYGYYCGGDIGNILALRKDILIHWLEGWWYNRNFTVGEYCFISNIWWNHKEIDERKIYHEGISF